MLSLRKPSRSPLARAIARTTIAALALSLFPGELLASRTGLPRNPPSFSGLERAECAPVAGGKPLIVKITWDSENRLVKVAKTDGTVVEHVYDADGNRVKTTTTKPGQPTEATDFLVDTSGGLSQVVAEIDATAGTLKAYYVRGDDLLSVMRPDASAPSGWQTRFYHSDYIGSVRRLTDETGMVWDGYTYSAFGEQLAHSGTDPQPYAFTGEPLDPNVGWQYHRARWMDPRIGRFAGMDPYPGRNVDPITLHKYLYAGANAVDRTDPSGLMLNSAELMGVMGAIMTLAAIALPRVQAVIGVINMNFLRFQRTIEYVGAGLGAVDGAMGWIEALDAMANRLMTTQVPYPAGPGPRGLQVGRIAGQNLADNFKHIDDFDFDTGAATSIKSTTQVGSASQLAKVIEGYASAFDLIDEDLYGRDAAGNRVQVPLTAIKHRNLLVAIPDEPYAWDLRPLLGALRRASQTYRTNIRIVPVKGLRGGK